MKLGKAFSDNIVIEHSVPVSLRHRDESPSWWQGAGRALLFSSIVVIAFFALVFRLVHLTIVRGHELRNLADGNRTRVLIRHAPRGILFDRTGKPITTSINSGRQYPYGSALAHLIGYIGELSADELQQSYFQTRQYGSGDRVGRSGAEEVFEEKLRGRNGKDLVEVDAQEKILRTLGRDPEVAGESVVLSVDADVSKIVEQSFPAGAKGAVVVSKPTTGEILALYSSPSFDPNTFTTGLTQTESESLLNNPDQPLFSRAIGGAYPPGSTFKIVTAIGALQEGAISGDTIIEDNGTITIGPFSFSNWYFTQYGKTDGPIDIVKAIQRSNDIFFYRVGEAVGITKLADWSHRIGIGKPLGIELGGEAGGLMPDPAWKKERFTTPADLERRNDQWYLGDTYHVAIGQGFLLVTPLQVNAWTNVIANGGKLCRPTIKKAVSNQLSAVSCKDLGIKKETIQLITEGMQKACATGGTGWPLFNFHVIPGLTRNPSAVSDTGSRLGGRDDKKTIPVACKTGTAEFGHPKNKTHAWFTAFAPLASDTGNQPIKSDQMITGEPEISITVLVEGAGEGSTVAAPVAKKILEAWFGR